MPIIRITIGSFVGTWNRHRIRAQPKRPWVVAGKPIVLYNNSTQDLKQLADPILLETLRQDTADWDADEYLPPDTLVWCMHQLEDIGFNPLNPPPRDDPAQPYKLIYIELRRRAILHEQSGRYFTNSIHLREANTYMDNQVIHQSCKSARGQHRAIGRTGKKGDHEIRIQCIIQCHFYR